MQKWLRVGFVTVLGWSGLALNEMLAQELFVEVEGAILTNTVWGPDMEVHVVGSVAVQGGAVLTILPGTALRLAPEVALVAEEGSGLDIAGRPGSRVSLMPLVPDTLWATVGASGSDSWIRMAHADLVGGQCSAFDGARAELDDSTLADFRRSVNATLLNKPILVTQYAAELRVDHCSFRNYHEVLLRYTPSEVVDSLFEDVHGDGLDFDYAPAGCVLRFCTFRNGVGTNIDAVDVGSTSQGVTIESCVMHGFPQDKGVSIGEHSVDIVVRDCVIWDVDSGIAVKDSSEAQIYHCTIADSSYGFRFYEKITGQGGGHAETWNNILWGNGESVNLDALSSISVDWSDVEGGYPGEGNLDQDPGFREATLADYRLASTSLLLGMGRQGESPGARFPVGSSLVDTDGDTLPDPWELQYGLDFNDPSDAGLDLDGDGLDNRSEYRAGTNPQDAGSRLLLTVVRMADGKLELGFEGVAGRAYVVEAADNLKGGNWTVLADFSSSAAGPVSLSEGTDAGGAGRWYRVRLADNP